MAKRLNPRSILKKRSYSIPKISNGDQILPDGLFLLQEYSTHVVTNSQLISSEFMYSEKELNDRILNAIECYIEDLSYYKDDVIDDPEVPKPTLELYWFRSENNKWKFLDQDVRR